MMTVGQESVDRLNALVGVIGRINDYSYDKDALYVFIMETAMRLVKCRTSLIGLEDFRGRKYVYLFRNGELLRPFCPEDFSFCLGAGSDFTVSADCPAAFGRFIPDAENVLCVPVVSGGVVSGVFVLADRSGAWNGSDIEFMRILAEHISVASRLSVCGCASVPFVDDGDIPFVGADSSVRSLESLADSLSGILTPVLVYGERGSGKEHFARRVHKLAGGTCGTFLVADCISASCPDVFEKLSDDCAKGSCRYDTVFVKNIDCVTDEILEGFVRFMDVSGEKVRIIVSSCRDLEELAGSGEFPSSVYFRISAMPVNMVPLRQRREDIAPSAAFYFERLNFEYGSCFTGISDDALARMKSYFWGGNMDELINVLRHGFIVGTPPYLRVSDIFSGLPAEKQDDVMAGGISSDPEGKTLRAAVNRFKREYVSRILEENSWNQTRAGKVLGIQRTYVARLINELHIRRK